MGLGRQVGDHLHRRHQPEADPGCEGVAEGRPRRRREPRPGARRRVRATWEIERAYGSYDALLADPDIEAVYISLPNTMHCEWSIRALEAGKHVLCEKPLSRHADEVEAAFDAADRAGRLLSEAFMYRHNPQTKKAARSSSTRARSASSGSCARAFSYTLYDEDNIRLRTDVEGGALMDVGCYCVSGSRLARRRAGAVVRPGVVRAVGHRLGVRRDAALPRRRARALRLRHRDARARRARGDRQRGIALPRRPVALQRARDRAAPRRRRRADRGRARGLLPARARERERRDPRRGRAPARARRRGRPGAHARGAAPVGDDRASPSRSSSRGPAASIAARASCSSTSPGSPLTPTAPTRVSPSNAATPPRKNVKNGSKLARSAGLSRTFSASSRRRAGVAARRGVGLPLRVQPRVGRGSVHRRGGDELAVIVGDEDGDGPRRLGDDVIDHGLCLRELHACILTDS